MKLKGELIADTAEAIALEETMEGSTVAPIVYRPEKAVWSYEQPYDDVQVIKELLAFYPDKVEISIS